MGCRYIIIDCIMGRTREAGVIWELAISFRLISLAVARVTEYAAVDEEEAVWMDEVHAMLITYSTK